MKSNPIALVGRIRQAISDLENVIGRAERHSNRAKTSNDDEHLDGVALNLYGFYTGLESIFEDIAKNFEESLPSGSNWHKELLLQISAEMNTLRPAVIRIETRRCLDEYRSFQHIVRNVYTFNLRGDYLQSLTDELRPCYDEVCQDLEEFIQFIEQLP